VSVNTVPTDIHIQDKTSVELRRRRADERASDKDVYATPSEYIRDLVRQDMQDHAVAINVTGWG
jgi:hypothetical protein